jgi:hypothetical protein
MGFLSFLVNKYNRTLGKTLVDGRSCIFAVNPENPLTPLRFAVPLVNSRRLVILETEVQTFNIQISY